MQISTSTKIRQYITSLNSRLYAWRFLQYAWSTCFLICSYTLREDAVETHWACRAPLCARGRCAVTTLCTPRARSERSVTTQSIAGQNSVGARWHAVGAPWHLHVMENVKLFAIFFSIFMRSHGALRNFKSQCQCRGIAVECDRVFRNKLHCNFNQNTKLFIQENAFENVVSKKGGHFVLASMCKIDNYMLPIWCWAIT